MEKSYNSSLKTLQAAPKSSPSPTPKKTSPKPKPTKPCKKSSQPTYSTPSAVTWYKLLKLVWSIVTSKFWRKKH